MLFGPEDRGGKIKGDRAVQFFIHAPAENETKEWNTSSSHKIIGIFLSETESFKLHPNNDIVAHHLHV